jgi:hypothetical protein
MGQLLPGYGRLMNYEATPAPPSTPSANITIAMTALASRLNARPTPMDSSNLKAAG